MTAWVATSYGALDISELESAAGAGIELMLLPTQPAEPVGLQGDPAALWRRLADGPVPDTELSPDQRVLVREYEEYGLASRDPSHPACTSSIPPPWLSSPLHELVYALIENVASERKINVVFIKGPALFKQGLREREHSGDVDVWVDPEQIEALCAGLAEWGWSILPTLWDGRPPAHSVTMRPESWGCEIDIHFDFPGIGVAQRKSFTLLQSHTADLDFAGVTVNVPSTDFQAIILALHLTRPEPSHPTTADSLDRAARALGIAGPPTLEIAHALHADAALAPVLHRAFPNKFTPPEYASPSNWLWRAQPSLFHGFRILLRMTPPQERASLLARILWPRDEIVLEAEKISGQQSRTAFIARCRRLLRGVSTLVDVGRLRSRRFGRSYRS